MAGVDQETFDAIDEFVAGTIAPEDEALRQANERADAAGLPPIQVTSPQGKLLEILARLVGAGQVLEFGTLGGYSTIRLARALKPGGRVITLEYDPKHAEVARENLDLAGVGESVEIRVGPALETLPQLEQEDVGPFDLVFIDADKQNTPLYFAWSLERTRPGGLIVADNVVRDGGLALESSGDETFEAQRRLHEELADEPRVEATTIQTVGAKGYDGFLVARVK